MLITTYDTRVNTLVDIKKNKKFEESKKFLIGCQAVGGKRVEEISKDNGMSRGYVYKQKLKVSQYAKGLDESKLEAPILYLDKKTIDRMILSLSFDCQAPYDGIVRFFQNAIREETVSSGYISELLSEATERARVFDEQIDLSGIRQGANDEIFQCGSPILTGVDPESAYTYLLEETSRRTAETWELYLNDLKDHGLNLETSINDGGTGLMAGIPKAFPDVEIQADTFHVSYEMGKEISKLERRAHKLIKDEQAIVDNLSGKRPRAKNKEALKEIQPKAAAAIETYDLLFVLFSWFKELLRFSGYNMTETMSLALWVLQEMDVSAVERPSLCGEIAKARRLLPSLLSFIGRLERGMEVIAKETELPVEGFRLMYRQLSYHPGSVENNTLLYEQVLLFGKRYDEAREEFERLMNRTNTDPSMKYLTKANGYIKY